MPDYLNITIIVTVLIATIKFFFIRIIIDKVFQTSLLIIILVILFIFPLLGKFQDERMVPDSGKLLNIVEQSALLTSLQLSFIGYLTNTKQN